VEGVREGRAAKATRPSPSHRGHRRRHDLHAQPLALPHRARRHPGRQARLLRKAAGDGPDRERRVAGPGGTGRPGPHVAFTFRFLYAAHEAQRLVRGGGRGSGQPSLALVLLYSIEGWLRCASSDPVVGREHPAAAWTTRPVAEHPGACAWYRPGPHLSTIDRGKWAHPHVSVLRVIARPLGVTVDELPSEPVAEAALPKGEEW